MKKVLVLLVALVAFASCNKNENYTVQPEEIVKKDTTQGPTINDSWDTDTTTVWTEF